MLSINERIYNIKHLHLAAFVLLNKSTRKN